MAKDFGDFEEIKENVPTTGGATTEENPESLGRVRYPRNKEVIGIVLQRFGGNRMEVNATDGKKRNCRVPGRYKRDLWLRPRDIVLIEPWPDDDEKGDIIFKYNPSAVNQLRKKGLLNSLKSDF